MTHANAASALQTLLDDGWHYHDTDSARLARELEIAAAERVDAALLAPFVHLATHTIGEHLGDWPRALRLGQRVLDGQTPNAESAKAWGRVHVAAVFAGATIDAMPWELAYLDAAGGDCATALLDLRFMLVGALVGSKRIDDAVRLSAATFGLIARVPAADFLDRSIAAVSNNLGWELYESAARAPAHDAALRLCADTALTHWRRCGNWIHVERALYLRALVANVSGEPAAALEDADTALALIAANGQRPLDAALLHLARAVALGACGDGADKAQAIAAADAAAAPLTAAELKAQFAVAREKALAAH